VTRSRRAALLLAAAVAIAVAGVLVRPSPPWSAFATRVVLAADASPTPAIVGDPRSSGEGAGIVGRPLVAIGGVLAIGLLAAGGTLLYVRLTRSGRRD
jgi:hypothetical protein